MTTALLLFAPLFASIPAHAAGWEQNTGRLGAQASAAGHRLAPKIESRARVLSGKAQATDLSVMFELGAKPALGDLTGWIAGRRFTESGPVAALLVGGETYEDPDQGPLSGKVFKLMVFGPKKADLDPADIYDDPGISVIQAVQELIRDDAKAWSWLSFTDFGAVWTKGAESFEVRKWGRYLICKYPDGYGYFFRKVSPLTGSSAAATGLKQGKEGEIIQAPEGTPAPAESAPAPREPSELERRFSLGTAPEERDITGWFAGRRFTAGGPAAALLAGFEVFDNPAVGPIEGSSFKIAVLGPETPDILPVNLYDMAGWVLMRNVSWNLYETGYQWTTQRTGGSITTSNGTRTYEIRKAGDFFIVRYPEGFGYFFKKIR